MITIQVEIPLLTVAVLREAAESKGLSLNALILALITLLTDADHQHRMVSAKRTR